MDGSGSHERRGKRHEATEDCREHGVFAEESTQWILINVGTELHLEAPEDSPSEKRNPGKYAQPAPNNSRFDGEAVLLERLVRKMEYQTRKRCETKGRDELHRRVADTYRIEPRRKQNSVDDQCTDAEEHDQECSGDRW